MKRPLANMKKKTMTNGFRAALTGLVKLKGMRSTLCRIGSTRWNRLSQKPMPFQPSSSMAATQPIQPQGTINVTNPQREWLRRDRAYYSDGWYLTRKYTTAAYLSRYY